VVGTSECAGEDHGDDGSANRSNCRNREAQAKKRQARQREPSPLRMLRDLRNEVLLVSVELAEREIKQRWE
jgi:hypothetical protein